MLQSLCGHLDGTSAKIRGVPPSLVDARMKNPVSPEAIRMYALLVLESMLLLPPGKETGGKTHELKN